MAWGAPCGCRCRPPPWLRPPPGSRHRRGPSHRRRPALGRFRGARATPPPSATAPRCAHRGTQQRDGHSSPQHDPRRRATMEPMRGRITVVSARELPFPRQHAVAAIRDIKNIERTEVKADAVVVSPETAERGTYRVRGRFAGFPWRGPFAYVLHEGGFDSRNAGVPPEEATIEGGFIVTPLAGGCTVIHYEQYVLAPSLRPLRYAIRLYLRWSMVRELRDLERLIAVQQQRAADSGAEVQDTAPPSSSTERRSPAGISASASTV